MMFPDMASTPDHTARDNEMLDAGGDGKREADREP
jgi:hypothetical protein